MKKSKEFKNFVNGVFEDVFEKSGLKGEWRGRIHYHLDREETKGDDSIEMGVIPCVLGRTFDVHVFKGAFNSYKRNALSDVVFAVCHELAHVCLSDFCKLVDQSYKSREEVEKEDELLANRVGRYLQQIYIIKGKRKCKKQKQSKSLNKTKNKRR